VGAGAVSSQVGVVDRRMERDRSGGADVVVRVLEDEGLKLSSQPLTLIQDALVVDGSRSALDGDVRTEVKVELERMSASSLDESARKRIAVAVTFAGIRKEADVMALPGDDNGELGDLLAPELPEALLHVADLLFKHGSVLSLAHAVTNEQHALRRLALSDALHPVLGHGSEVFVDVGGGDHLHAVTVGLNFSPVLSEERIGRDGNGGKGCSLTGASAWGRVGNIGTDDHGGDCSEISMGCIASRNDGNLLEGDLGATLGMTLDLATLVQPPSLALTFMQTLEMYCGEADMTCLAWRTCEATPKRMSHDFLMRRYTSTLRSLTTKKRKLGGMLYLRIVSHNFQICMLM
jgi:hypothetical protein